MLQMAKRLKFSVVGLPHYTIWHLYEPSVDDVRHMEEMELERKNKEAEEKAKQDRLDKINNHFESPSKQWEKDKLDLQKIKGESSEGDKDGAAEKSKDGSGEKQAGEKQAGERQVVEKNPAGDQ